MEGSDQRERRPRPTAHELARYEALFAGRTYAMRSSAIRDLLAITERPEVISLAGGLPDTSLFGGELLAKLMASVAVEAAAKALQYGPTEGMYVARECVAQVMAAEGTIVDPDDVIITSGGQQGIDLACKVLVDPGDVIVAEAPTYPGAVPTFGSYEAEVVQVALDDDGLPIDALLQTLDRLQADGKRPKFIYTIPNFQNPGGVTMSLERRHRLVALARERELVVVEDNPYGLLRYEGESLPTLYALDAASSARADAADFVIYLGTMSKILSPGLRMGWLVAPRPLQNRLNLGKQAADLCSSSLGQLFAATYFRDADWLGYIERLKAVYGRRRDAMLAALAEFFPPHATWTTPGGGMFVWATLPDYIDTTDLLARAVETENVAFVPGRGAFADGRGASSMRLNFSAVDEPLIREGIRRIGRVIAEQIEMYGTLTGGPPTQPAGQRTRPSSALPSPGSGNETGTASDGAGAVAGGAGAVAGGAGPVAGGAGPVAGGAGAVAGGAGAVAGGAGAVARGAGPVAGGAGAVAGGAGAVAGGAGPAGTGQPPAAGPDGARSPLADVVHLPRRETSTGPPTRRPADG